MDFIRVAGIKRTKSFRAWTWSCGLDASQQMGRLTAKRLKQLGVKYNLVNAHAQSLPFSSSSLSQIVATFPTEYIVDERTLHEIWRVLCSRGKLIVMPVAWITGDSPLERAAAWIFRITGQAPEWDDRVLEPALKVGFQIKVHRKKLKSSELLLIRAWKVEV